MRVTPCDSRHSKVPLGLKPRSDTGQTPHAPARPGRQLRVDDRYRLQSSDSSPCSVLFCSGAAAGERARPADVRTAESLARDPHPFTSSPGTRRWVRPSISIIAKPALIACTRMNTQKGRWIKPPAKIKSGERKVLCTQPIIEIDNYIT